MWDAFPLILAQDDAQPATAPTAAPTGAPAGGDATTTTPGQPVKPTGSAPTRTPFGGDMLFIILAIFVGMILIQVMSGRKDRKRREKMLAAIKKGDRVKTIGGVRGSVMEVRDQEVLVKVDENNNTRIWFDRSAVQAVVDEKN